jgi:two-component system alkaline phosphatase synthesis response regulator PhoP
MKTQDFKILIIDSDPQLLLQIKTVLGSEGFDVFVSSNSREAIELAKKELPQLILLDIMMPDIDGIDICLELKATEELKRSLIVFQTSRAEDYSQIAAFNAGADDYIIKPVKPRVLLGRLKALLKRHSVALKPASPTDVAGLIIDRERYLILKDGQQIVLPRKEFELLALLSTSPRRVFTRNEISQLIWGYEIFSRNRTIDVHIRKLREKLGDRYIKTIKGIGYSLEL